MSHFLFCAVVFQVALTFAAAHAASRRERLDVIGVCSLTACVGWLITMMGFVGYYSANSLTGWAPVAAFVLGVASLATYVACAKLDQKYRNTPAAH